MIRPDVLSFLRCPEDHSPLARVDSELVAQLNSYIRFRKLQNRAGQWIEKSIDGALTRASRDLVYPVIDGIPVLVRDEAISLAQLGTRSNGDS
jgi:uncharacterized protein YbaR (Trm112 family)